MYQVSSNYLATIKQPSRKFKSTVKIYDTIFTDTDVIQIDYEENSNPDESFEIGSVNSSKIEITLANSAVLDAIVLDGAPVKPVISLMTTANTYEDIPLGVFFIDSADVGKNTMKIIAYDSMMKMEQAYFSDLTYPASISAVVNEICTKANIECVTTLPTNLNITKMEGCTYRQAISYIASFLGDFARFNRTGKLEFVSYTDSGFRIGPENYISFKTSRKNFTIGRMACQLPSGAILTEGSNGNEIQFTSPIITQKQLYSIFNVLKNIEYMPYTCDFQGNPALQSGDKITITGTAGASYTTLVMSSKFSYKGGLTGAISAVGKSDTAQEFSQTGNITQTVQKVVTEQANIKVLLANTATIENLTATNTRIGTLETDTAKINTLLVHNLTAVNMQAGFITAESGLIANGAIGDAMIANVSAGKINTGILNTSLVTIQSKSGNMFMSDNTIQIKDSNRVRVQIGKDASSDYNMYVWDVSGNLMFDATGLKANGIKDKIIRDDMVSDTANIDAKINIDSLFAQINGSTNTVKASKIYLDTQAQTLDVEFTSLKTIASDTANTVTSQETAIKTMQGQISARATQTSLDATNANLDSAQGKNKWLVRMYNKAGQGGTIISYDTIKGLVAFKTFEWADATNNWMNVADDYVGNATTYVYLNADYSLSTTLTTDDDGAVYLNNTLVANTTSCTAKSITLNFKAGWNQIDVLWGEGGGGDGFVFGEILSQDANIKKMCCYLNINSISEYRMSSAEQKITPDAITNTVRSSTSYINDLGAKSDKHIPDTRNDNQPPSWYWSNYPYQIANEFKYRNVLGVSGSADYGNLTTTVQWGDSSGSPITQEFKSSDGLFRRYSTSNNTWSTWEQIENTAGSQAKIDYFNQNTVQPLAGRVSTAEQKITADAIVSTVRKSTAYTSDLNGRVSTSDFSTYKSQTATEISAKVSNSDFSTYKQQTATEISNKVSTTDMGTVIQQHSDDVQIAVGDIFRDNLIRNSDFQGADSGKTPHGWWYWGNAVTFGSQGQSGYNDPGTIYIMNNTTNVGGLWQDHIPLKPNTTYTVSMVARKEPNANQPYFVLEYRDANGNAISGLGNETIALNLDGQRHSYTFTTKSGWSYVQGGIWHTGSVSSAGSYLVIISYIKLKEGASDSAWSPSPDSFSTQLVDINSEHLRTIYTDGSYSEMNKDGFAHYRAGGADKLPYHYLVYHGSVSVPIDGANAGGQGVIDVTLPDEFDNIPNGDCLCTFEDARLPDGWGMNCFNCSGCYNVNPDPSGHKTIHIFVYVIPEGTSVSGYGINFPNLSVQYIVIG